MLYLNTTTGLTTRFRGEPLFGPGGSGRLVDWYGRDQRRRAVPGPSGHDVVAVHAQRRVHVHLHALRDALDEHVRITITPPNYSADQEAAA